MAAEHAIDPMQQFSIQPLAGGSLSGSAFQFTNSALWMFLVALTIVVFMLGGMQRKPVPSRWQMAAESLVGFISGLVSDNIGPEGRKFVPWVFTLFSFIMVSNLMGLMPFGIVHAWHPFTVTSQFTLTGELAVLSFGTVLAVGFWRHGFKFFTLFIPHGTPLPLMPIIIPIEFISFMIRPFSLGLRLFIAMLAGHILVDVLGNFVVQGIGSGAAMGYVVSIVSYIFVVGIMALELLVCCIQAYVFSLLTSLYLNDAVHLHLSESEEFGH